MPREACASAESSRRAAAAERQRRGDAWVEIAKVLPGRTPEAVKARWDGTLVFRFMSSSLQHGGGTKRARVGWDGDDARTDGVDSFHETNLAGSVEWPVTASSAAADDGRSSDDGSPPRLCLPTGNVIDDGTFCPDDELFLHARPPVSAIRALQTVVRATHIIVDMQTWVLNVPRYRICCGRCTESPARHPRAAMTTLVDLACD